MFSSEEKALNLPVPDAAKMMGVSEAFLRASLQAGLCPFGWAVQITGEKYTYYISPKKFFDYVGNKEEK